MTGVFMQARQVNLLLITRIDTTTTPFTHGWAFANNYNLVLMENNYHRIKHPKQINQFYYKRMNGHVLLS